MGVGRSGTIKSPFLDALAERVLLGDGGMGTMLYSKGIYLNTCFDELNLTNPGIVQEVHREYVRAGADINRAGARIAREEAGPDVFLAGSMGPLGVKVEPWGQLAAKEAEDAFAEQARAILNLPDNFCVLFVNRNQTHVRDMLVNDFFTRLGRGFQDTRCPALPNQTSRRKFELVNTGVTAGKKQ